MMEAAGTGEKISSSALFNKQTIFRYLTPAGRPRFESAARNGPGRVLPYKEGGPGFIS